MKPRHPKRKQLLSLCAEVHPDDGVDPRKFFGEGRARRDHDRKALQLARQVEEALRLSLAGEFEVLSVEPAPDATRLAVTVLPTGGAMERLLRSLPRLRCEVAAAIHRRRAPDLVFRFAGPTPGEEAP